MGRFLLSRLFESLVVLLVMSFILYGLMGLMPGDPIDIMIMSNPAMTPADVERLRALYGLDQPLVVRYWNWLTAALSGDLGYSREHMRPVLTVMLPALGQTLKLIGLVFVFAVGLALVLGVRAGLKPGGAFDTSVSFVSFAGISLPTFWLALILILVFAVTLNWLPASGIRSPRGDSDVWDQAKYMILPVATLVIANTGVFARYARAATIEVMRQDFIRTARAKGASERRVVMRHALRNSLIPVVTVVALSFGQLFSGALITETMFAQPGLGKMIYNAIQGNDFNLAMVGLMFATAMTLIGNLLADIAYAWIDPRITLS